MPLLWYCNRDEKRRYQGTGIRTRPDHKLLLERRSTITVDMRVISMSGSPHLVLDNPAYFNVAVIVVTVGFYARVVIYTGTIFHLISGEFPGDRKSCVSMRSRQLDGKGKAAKRWNESIARLAYNWNIWNGSIYSHEEYQRPRTRLERRN